MNEILDTLEGWLRRGKKIAVATVVETWGSSPRPVGSKLAVTSEGDIAGSVSAGCVEGAVIEAAQEVIETGQPRLLTFGVADEEAWEVGLACGGTIRVFVEPFSAFGGVYEALKRHLEAREPVAVISVLEGPTGQLNRKLIVSPDGRPEGDLSLTPEQQERVVGAVRSLIEREEGGTLELGEGLTVFVDVYPPAPRLIIVGAVHIARLLVPMAGLLGFDTYVIDPRRAFATRERFPDATALLHEWPRKALARLPLDSFAYVVVLTHDPKLDDPALEVALASDARYVGALGSRRTHEKRVRRLREAGLSDEQLARLHAPIGIPLGGRSPAEIALSIMAEIVQVRNTSPASAVISTAG
ncbi:MAG TPA: XdhC/CoxI family protein [Chloroflexi bacterium]|nr:XdhC/CoxI family protein [Chloroflexota bacterium]